MTQYVVLRKHAETGSWVEDGPRVESVSAEAAIRKAAVNESGVYVAVPLRSWNPTRVTVETNPTVKLSAEEEFPA